MIEPDGKDHECERCGDCCTHGGPILYRTDLHLFERGILKPSDIFALRKGELEYDIITEEVECLPDEMLRMKEIPGSRYCIFYSSGEGKCGIYENRPHQCVQYECWNPKKLFSVMAGERLSRAVLFGRVPSMLELVDEHERMCSYERIGTLVSEVQEGSEEAAEELLSALRYDTKARAVVAEKLNMAEDDVDGIFGRPLSKTIRMYGYDVIKDEEGAYCLTMRAGNEAGPAPEHRGQ